MNENPVQFYLDGGTAWMAYVKKEPFLYLDVTDKFQLEHEKETTNSIHFYLKDGFNLKEAFDELVKDGWTDKFATDWIPAVFFMHRPKGKTVDECVVEIRLRIKDSLHLSNYITTNDNFNKFSYWQYLAEKALPKIKNGVMFKGTNDEDEEEFRFDETYEEWGKNLKKT